MTKIYEIQERAKIYLENKTFTFIKEIMPNDFEAIRNGFIISKHDDFLVFFDVVIQKEIPIPLDKILDIQPSSKRDMTLQEAKLIMERYYDMGN